MAPKRKAEAAGDESGGVDATKKTAKKPAIKKIPKLVKAKILALMAESESPLDISTMKMLLEKDWEFPDSKENKNKVWKALKELGDSETFGRCGNLYHGGKESASYKALTSEDFAKAEEEKKKPVEKYTCPYCDCADYYCQVSEPLPGPHDGSMETIYKCLNSCYREFKVLVHGDKRIYHWTEYNEWDQTKEVNASDVI